MWTRNLIIGIFLVLVLETADANNAADANRGKALSIICADCHGDDGLGDEDIPAIAGLEAAYLRNALLDYKSGARIDENEDMGDIAGDLSGQDIADLAAHYTTLPGR